MVLQFTGSKHRFQGRLHYTRSGRPYGCPPLSRAVNGLFSERGVDSECRGSDSLGF